MNSDNRPLTSPLVYSSSRNKKKLNKKNLLKRNNNIKDRRHSTFHDSSYYKYNIHDLKHLSNISSKELRHLPKPPSSKSPSLPYNRAQTSVNHKERNRINQYYHRYHQTRPKSRGLTDFRLISESLKTSQYYLNQQIDNFVKNKTNVNTIDEWIHIIEKEGNSYNEFFNQMIDDYEMPINKEKAFLWSQLGNQWNNLFHDILKKLKVIYSQKQQQNDVHNYTLDDVNKLRSRLQQRDIEIDTLSSCLNKSSKEITDLKNELDIMKRESELEEIRVNELLNVYNKQKITLTNECTELRHQHDTLIATNLLLEQKVKVFAKEKKEIIEKYEEEIELLTNHQSILESEINVQNDEIAALDKELVLFRKREAELQLRQFCDKNIQTYSTDLFSTTSQTDVQWLLQDPYIIIKHIDEPRKASNTADQSIQTVDNDTLSIKKLFNEQDNNNEVIPNSLHINIINDDNNGNDDIVEHDLARLDAYIEKSRRLSTSIAQHHDNLLSGDKFMKTNKGALPYSIKTSHEFIVKNVLNAYYYSTLTGNNASKCKAAADVAKDITKTKLYEIAKHRVHSLHWIMNFIRSIVYQCYKFKIYQGYTLHEWVLSWLSFEYGITELLKQRTAELIISLVTHQARCTDVSLFSEYLLHPNNHPKGEEELYIQIYGLSDQVGNRKQLETLKLKIEKAYYVLQQICKLYIKDERVYNELKLKLQGLDEVRISELFHLVREEWYKENLKRHQEDRFEELWYSIDEDNDGWINLEEFISMLSNVKPPINESDASNIYNNLRLLHGDAPRLTKTMCKNLCINMMQNGSVFMRKHSEIDENLIKWWTTNGEYFNKAINDILDDVDVLSVLKAKIQLILTHQETESKEDLYKMCNMFTSKMAELLITHLHLNLTNTSNTKWLEILVNFIHQLIEFNSYHQK